MHLPSSAGRSGFTLIELLAVVLIMGILSAFALPQYRRSVERARVAEAQALMRSIYDSCERLGWERSTPADQTYNCIRLNDTNENIFPKLDITVKGRFSGRQLRTDNFIYEIVGPGRLSVNAIPLRGMYNDARITFDGHYFSCTPSSSAACKAWGASGWNKI